MAHVLGEMLHRGVAEHVKCYPNRLKYVSPRLRTRGPFLESPGNLSGPISDFGDKCFLKEVNFC